MYKVISGPRVAYCATRKQAVIECEKYKDKHPEEAYILDFSGREETFDEKRFYNKRLNKKTYNV